ncbi:hypothetical protein PINS_up023163 [Pythium insidiosum]|nr:hypothetical protein PINS_up011291 [Pythium insidiosum]GLE10891.1 hypothetical protein PINS_up023163 [Pythium insidiosum]
MQNTYRDAMKHVDASADLVVAFNGRGIIRRGVCGGLILAVAVSAPGIAWIVLTGGPSSSFPTESLLIFVIAVLMFFTCFFVEHSAAKTQRCIVSATALEHSVVRWTTTNRTTVPLDLIKMVNLRFRCVDWCFGVETILIETAMSLEYDRDGEKRPSAAALVGVLDAENVRRAILARRDALLRQRRPTVTAPPYVVIEMASNAGLRPAGH